MADFTAMKKSLKKLLAWIVFSAGVHRLWFRNRAVIVLFHRVDNRLGNDPISCTADAFEAYCRFFARFFRVISLSELLDRLSASQSISRCLVVTFDDGYKDNWETAAPVLRKHGLTACFFVSTDFIGSSESPWWDADKGIQSEWMDWEDVRGLDELGLEVGAHTKSHVDLGTVNGEVAREEIVGSGHRLESELSERIDLFSFPYGQRENITEQNRAIVREAGYRCCLSAVTGDVRPDSDPFDLRRMAVSPWYASPYQFGFDLLTERGSG